MPAKNYVRITFRETVGAREVKRTWWAVKLSRGRYKKVDAEGQWGNDNVLHIFAGTPDSETPALIDRHYGTLVTT